MRKKVKCLLKRKNKIMYLVIIILIIIAILYIKTDVLKTKEQLFWKYMSLEIDNIMQIISNDNVEQYNETLKKSFYVKECKMSIFSKLKLFKTIDVEISQKGNNIDKITNTNIQLDYNKENLTEASIIKDSNYFIIKNDYISSNYIGFENKNLKVLAQKFGIKNTELIPDEIKEINIEELFLITEQEKNHIFNKYIPIFRRNIKNKNYSKQINEKKDNNNDSTIEYKINISEIEFKSAIIEILKELYNDEISLKLISSKIEILNSESLYCNIDNIKEKIQEIIAYFEAKEAKDEEFISIIIYSNKKSINKIELKLSNNRTISIQTDNKQNTIIINQSNVKNKITDLTNINNIANTVLNSITEITYSKNIINDNENKVDVNIVLDLGIDKVTVNYNYVEQIENFVDGIIDRRSIDYLDVKNMDKEFYDGFLEKWH